MEVPAKDICLLGAPFSLYGICCLGVKTKSLALRLEANPTYRAMKLCDGHRPSNHHTHPVRTVRTPRSAGRGRRAPHRPLPASWGYAPLAWRAACSAHAPCPPLGPGGPTSSGRGRQGHPEAAPGRRRAAGPRAAGAGMEAQAAVVAQMESLAFEPAAPGVASAEEPAASMEVAPGQEPAASGKVVPSEESAASVEVVPDEEPVVRVEEASGEERAATVEEASGEKLAANVEEASGEARAANVERPPNSPSPLRSSGEDQATPPLDETDHGGPPASASSSDSDSDTDSDTSSTTSPSSSSSSAVSDEDDYPNRKDNRSFCVKTKDELPFDELPPVEDLSIILPDNVELKPFGTVSSIIEQLVIIESLKGLPPINEDSIIFKKDRQAAGKIFEIFGPVLHPFYVLRFNSSEHIKAKDINVQDEMYFAPSVEDFTQYIFAEKLKQEKGSDASWKNDEEPPPEALDFSDDEKEREAKQKKKPQSQGRKKPKWGTNASSESKGINQSMPQPASRGYSGRGFFRGSAPGPSGPPGFLRPQARPPQLYSSDNRLYQESPVFMQPQRKENPVMPQYPFPPPVFGSANNMQQFHLLPSDSNMMWTVPNTYNSFLPPPPPPPPPDSHSFQFRPY